MSFGSAKSSGGISEGSASDSWGDGSGVPGSDDSASGSGSDSGGACGPPPPDEWLIAADFPSLSPQGDLDEIQLISAMLPVFDDACFGRTVRLFVWTDVESDSVDAMFYSSSELLVAQGGVVDLVHGTGTPTAFPLGYDDDSPPSGFFAVDIVLPGNADHFTVVVTPNRSVWSGVWVHAWMRYDSLP